MKISRQASKGHLVAGGLLATLSFSSLVASFYIGWRILPVLIFFFGVWGGVELGRYLEVWLSRRKEINSGPIKRNSFRWVVAHPDEAHWRLSGSNALLKRPAIPGCAPARGSAGTGRLTEIPFLK